MALVEDYERRRHPMDSDTIEAINFRLEQEGNHIRAWLGSLETALSSQAACIKLRMLCLVHV